MGVVIASPGHVGLSSFSGGNPRRVGFLHWPWPKRPRSQWLENKPDPKIFINMTWEGHGTNLLVLRLSGVGFRECG